MKNLLLVIVLAAALSFPVHATTVTAPVAPSEIEKYMPDESISFSKDLWYIVRSALGELTPNISEAMEICASVIAIQLLITVLRNFSGISKNAVTLIGITCLSILLLTPSKIMINLGVETVQSISEYNKLLLPIMTAAVAAQGGTATSAALYTGTIVLDAVLTTMIGKILIPLLYCFIAIGIALAAIEGQILKNFLALIKWIITWLLKISIYIFTGYMGITGVISGTVDSAALKATKLAISGSVPVQTLCLC